MTASRRLITVLMMPIRRLLDGRFADVNRRVDDTRASVGDQSASIRLLSAELAAYSMTLGEGMSYTGVAMRRLEDSLEAHEERVLSEVQQLQREIGTLAERGYLERLDRTSRGPLSELDGALASAINLAHGHRGFAAQANLWFNPPVTVELGEARAQLSDVNERIVELPFAFAQLARLKPPARILDVGGAESTFGLSAASLGYQVTVLDPQGIPYEHPNLVGLSVKLEDWKPDGERFAAVFLISAIEHFGLDAYDEHPADGSRSDLLAMARIQELLSDDGVLVLTTPYGKASVNDLERVYDDDGLTELLGGWEVLERHVFSRSDRRTWQPGASGSAGTVLVTARPASKP